MQAPQQQKTCEPFLRSASVSQSLTIFSPRPTDMQKRAVVMEPEEKKALALLQQIQAISRDKESKRKESKQAHKAERQKKLAKCVTVAFSLATNQILTLLLKQGRREAGRTGEAREAGVLCSARPGREAQGGRRPVRQEAQDRVDRFASVVTVSLFPFDGVSDRRKALLRGENQDDRRTTNGLCRPVCPLVSFAASGAQICLEFELSRIRLDKRIAFESYLELGDLGRVTFRVAVQVLSGGRVLDRPDSHPWQHPLSRHERHDSDDELALLLRAEDELADAPRTRKHETRRHFWRVELRRKRDWTRGRVVEAVDEVGLLVHVQIRRKDQGGGRERWNRFRWLHP